ncbi:MAG: hypothetical protein CL489_16755 [Acidobacteria bacterium]|nr:hypothetical protein [Acidobacteriota bacterium]
MSVRSSTKRRKNSYTKMVTKILGDDDADTAILVSTLLPSNFWLRGFQIFNGIATGSSDTIEYLDLYDGPSGVLIWRTPSAPTGGIPSTIMFDNAYIPISNGLYVEWTDAPGSVDGPKSGITVFWT